jgi:hypothetical protein
LRRASEQSREFFVFRAAVILRSSAYPDDGASNRAAYARSKRAAQKAGICVMIVCAILSSVTAAISGFFGFGDFAALGEGSRGVLLAVTAFSATIAVGAFEAHEAEGPSKKD